MKYLTLFILTILIQPLFGQKELHGVVFDSISNDPIPFASVFLNDEIKTTTDFDGKFRLSQITDTKVVLTISAAGYPAKDFQIQVTEDSLKLSLKSIPLDDVSNFIIWGKATDTTFYENEKIQKINYLGHDVEEFYRNGQMKFKSANGSTRSWYENGQLESQSVLKNNHFRYKTTWYPNGQKESEGTVYWGHNDKKNEGEWFKNDDWKYWTKKGKRKNNR